MTIPSKRSYQQFCGLARALDVVGERWTLLLVREFLLGPRRYSELLASLPGLTTNLLADRLRELTSVGIIESHDGAYALSSDGAALEPVIMELARWGGRYLGAPKRGERVDPAWVLLSLKRRYKGGLALTLGVHVDDTWFTLHFEPEWLRVTKARPERSSASLHLSTVDFMHVFAASGTPDAKHVDGNARAVKRALSALLPREYASAPPSTKSKTRFVAESSRQSTKDTNRHALSRAQMK